MKLDELRIGMRLLLGLGLIVLLTATLAGLAWVGADALWRQTEGLNDHPLAVQQAIADLQSEILVADVAVKGLLLSRSAGDSLKVLADLEASQEASLRHLALASDRFLGPTEDVARVREEVVPWFAQRREIVRLARDGRWAEAASLDGPGLAGVGRLGPLLASIDRMEGFARNRAAQFFREAQVQRASLERQLAGGAAFVLALSLVIGWLLTSSIRRPLAEVTRAAQMFRQGRMDARVAGLSGGELGDLGSAFNAMAGEIQEETALRESAAALFEVLVRETDLEALFRSLLLALLQRTGAQVGAVYLRNGAGSEFEHFTSIGLSAAARRSFSAQDLEGELGPALTSGELQRVTDIPDDTRFSLVAVAGDLLPREIVTLPLSGGGQVIAVVSLASVRPFPSEAIRLLRTVSGGLAARVHGVLEARKTQVLAARLAEQNRELETQGRELVSQAGELAEHNVELEAQKRQLDDANRLKSVFLSNMSHELRTPLNSVIALSGVLERRLAAAIGEEEHGYLEVIQRNGRHLLALINDILDLSRIEAGREELRITPIVVRDLAAEVLSVLEVHAQEKGVALVNLVDAGLPLLESDADRCRHILQNLLANAVKFTEKGRVEISAAPDGERIRIAVLDTGIGIPGDKLDVIFEEFRQADETTSRRYGGTGLGLSIARRYARLLGGDLTVTSVLGAGSTFTLTLPRAATRSATAAAAPARLSRRIESRRPVPAGKGQRILLVEDSEPAIVQMTEVLHAGGYRVEVTRNGKEALERVARDLPDAVILDLMMPEVDGLQVLESFRRSPRTRDLPVIILTAKAVTTEEIRSLESNHVHQLIQKGDVDRSELLAAVAGMLEPGGKVVPGPAVATSPRPARHRRPRRPGRPLVLVVEDNADNLRTARALLQDRYEVTEAQNGREGVDAARRRPPDLILMDIAMPVLDGILALAELRKDHELRDIPVYALTASAMTGDREAILAHGFDGYISKPIDHTALMATVAEAVGE